MIDAWHLHYNLVRPHTSLRYLTLTEFKQETHPHQQSVFFWVKLSRLKREGQSLGWAHDAAAHCDEKYQDERLS